MFKKLIFPVFLIAISSCGIQRQVNRSFAGKSVAVIEEQLGSPKEIRTGTGDTIYIFEKREKLRSTEISQGRVTLDPVITPKVHKTERFYFTVKNGVVVKTRLEEEYER